MCLRIFFAKLDNGVFLEDLLDHTYKYSNGYAFSFPYDLESDFYILKIIFRPLSADKTVRFTQIGIVTSLAFVTFLSFTIRLVEGLQTLL